MANDIERRILALEKGQSVPGTMINRVLKDERGFGWCIAVGTMEMPKSFFYGDTIEEALCSAEKWRRETTTNGKKP